MKGWYFAAKDRRLRYGDNRIAAVGVTHAIDGTPQCCKHGLHASKRALDALPLGAGPVAFRVTLGGEMDHCTDKSAGQTRTYDAGGIDCTNALIEFACCAAMGAMLMSGHDDQRSWEAIEAAFAWTRGEISHDDLRNAAASAAYAASAVDANAAYDAYDAAYATSYAANAAASAASSAAAAAYAASAVDANAAYDAYDAAYATSYAANAAKDELNDLLEQMLDEAMSDE